MSDGTPEHRIDSTRSTDGGPRLWLYGATVFVASGVLLVLEIAAGRLIAPYVGVSLYSWTSIIGVILAGLSLGNWLGGVWADRGAGHAAAGAALALAGVASLAVLLVLTFVAPIVLDSRLSLLGASFLLVASLFFVPSVLLGVITPLLTTLAIAAGTRTGRIVGSMHALAALGSICGTFLAGFWLVQHYGTRAVLVGCALVLLAASVPFALAARRGVAVLGALALATAGVAFATGARSGFENPCDRETAYYCVRVEDASGDVPFGRARVLVLDYLVHGISHETEPGMLVSPYVHLADELVLGYLGDAARSARYLFVGGGAYTHPRAVAALAPEADLTVIEIDPAVTEAAGRDLWLDAGTMRIVHGDGRVALARLGDESFDVIVGDVFHDVALPYHLVTSEYAALVARRLRPGGLYVLNVVDAWPDPLLVRAIVKTLEAHFEHVHVWVESVPGASQRETFVVSATDSFEPPPEIVAQRGFERRWERVTRRLAALAATGSEVPFLSDDFVPVDRLVARLVTTDLGR